MELVSNIFTLPPYNITDQLLSSSDLETWKAQVEALDPENQKYCTTLILRMHGHNDLTLEWSALPHLDIEKVKLALKTIQNFSKNRTFLGLYQALEGLFLFCKNQKISSDLMEECYWILDGKPDIPFYGRDHFGEKPFLAGLCYLLSFLPKEKNLLPSLESKAPIHQLFLGSEIFPPITPLNREEVINLISTNDPLKMLFTAHWIGFKQLGPFCAQQGFLNFFELLHEHYSDIDKIAFLQRAVRSNQLALVKFLHAHGTPINTPQWRALIGAASDPRLDSRALVKYLVDNGATTSNLIIQSNTVYSWYFTRALFDYTRLIGPDPLSETLIAAKLISSMVNFAGQISLPEGLVVLPGGYPNLFFARWAELFSRTPELAPELATSFSFASKIQEVNSPETYQILIEKIQGGELVILPVNSDGHVAGILFYKKFLAIYDSLSPHTPLVQYIIDPKKITKNLLEKLLSYSQTNALTVAQQILGTSLPKELEPSLSTKLSPPSLFAPGNKTGSCAYSASKMLVHVALTYLGYPDAEFLAKKLNTQLLKEELARWEAIKKEQSIVEPPEMTLLIEKATHSLEKKEQVLTVLDPFVSKKQDMTTANYYDFIDEMNRAYGENIRLAIHKEYNNRLKANIMPPLDTSRDLLPEEDPEIFSRDFPIKCPVLFVKSIKQIDYFRLLKQTTEYVNYYLPSLSLNDRAMSEWSRLRPRDLLIECKTQAKLGTSKETPHYSLIPSHFDTNKGYFHPYPLPPLPAVQTEAHNIERMEKINKYWNWFLKTHLPHIKDEYLADPYKMAQIEEIILSCLRVEHTKIPIERKGYSIVLDDAGRAHVTESADARGLWNI